MQNVVQQFADHDPGGQKFMEMSVQAENCMSSPPEGINMGVA